MKDDLKTELEKPLEGKYVKTRNQSGVNLSYIESWHVIKRANELFGFDGWSRITKRLDCVVNDTYQKNGKEMYRVSYVATVTVIVDGVSRDGTGAGHGFGQSPTDAHESAVKEAESDAMKRAFMTFGNQFGLALYDKEQKEVDYTPEPDWKAIGTNFAGMIDRAKSIESLDALTSDAEMDVFKQYATADWKTRLNEKFEQKRKELQNG